ncbi:MAG: hypothetical protein WCG67_03790, partial [Ferruginibacter sp.]
AEKKGLKPGIWKLNTILSWLFTEFVGLFIGVSLWGFTKDNFIQLNVIGLFAAFGGYLIIRAILEKKPTPIKEDINQITSEDLQPPKK